jgi:glyceraldehyde 3-phosphate dehydrogenase
MVKVKMNEYGHSGCLVIRAFINFGKVDVVAIAKSFTDLNYMVSMFQYYSTHDKFHGMIRLRKGNLTSAGSSSLFV